MSLSVGVLTGTTSPLAVPRGPGGATAPPPPEPRPAALGAGVGVA